MKTILPGGTIGIWGGGQFGRMLAMESRRMGYRVGVLDPVAHGPAAQVSDFFVQSELSNFQGVKDFAAEVDVVTIETELVPWKVLAEIETQKGTRPSSCVLAFIQDRLVQLLAESPHLALDQAEKLLRGLTQKSSGEDDHPPGNVRSGISQTSMSPQSFDREGRVKPALLPSSLTLGYSPKVTLDFPQRFPEVRL